MIKLKQHDSKGKIGIILLMNDVISKLSEIAGVRAAIIPMYSYNLLRNPILVLNMNIRSNN